MPFLRTAGRLNVTWKDIWGYVEPDLGDVEASLIVREFIAQDDIVAQRELAQMGA